jgi:hypothetical protein
MLGNGSDGSTRPVAPQLSARPRPGDWAGFGFFRRAANAVRCIMPKPQAALLLCAAFLAGVLARDVFVDRASASGDALTRGDLDRVVRALEAQAKATGEVAREVRDAGRACK